MPELPEVETTRRGITPYVIGNPVTEVVVRQRQLRWPVPEDLERQLRKQAVIRVTRRGKYLLLNLSHGCLLIHLGMSGSLRIVAGTTPPGSHDHVDIRLADGSILRYNDPRRFGSMHWTTAPEQHPLLARLGPEPLSGEFNGEALYQIARGRRVSIKGFIMDSQVVVGVGNIYASEALFLAGIDPRRAAGRVSRRRMQNLVEAIRTIMADAIALGGTTLRDFVGSDGRPGYFRQSLNVYGRGGQPCHHCRRALRNIRLTQRSTVFCPTCQR